jgi:regulator of protease activity HflC (stomatin/prohibitin superfamily)
MDPIAIASVALVVVVLLVLVYLSVRIVAEYDRLVVFRFGRTGPDLIKGPGIVFLIPLVDRPVRVDLREQFIEIPSQTAITKDNAPINIDFLIYWRIADPLKSVVNVAFFAGALQGIATTTLRAVIGDILLDDVLSKRDQINEVLRVKLDEQTERWGGKVTIVEIREIIPPRDIQEAMNRQLSAERTRRAVITESEGTRQSTINVAEGDKQSQILRAEGERQAAILRAEGFSQALERIFQAASGIDEKTMTLQYFDALKNLGATQATKFVIPLEFAEMGRMLSRYVDKGMQGDGPGAACAAPSAARPVSAAGPAPATGAAGPVSGAAPGGPAAATPGEWRPSSGAPGTVGGPGGSTGPGTRSSSAGDWTPGADRSLG